MKVCSDWAGYGGDVRPAVAARGRMRFIRKIFTPEVFSEEEAGEECCGSDEGSARSAPSTLFSSLVTAQRPLSTSAGHPLATNL